MQDEFPYGLNELLFGGSRNILNISLRDYRVLTPEMLYDDFRRLSKDVVSELGSTLYVISRIPKLRFMVERCRIGMNMGVVGRLASAHGRALKFSASMAKFWHEHRDFYERFASPEEFAHGCFEALDAHTPFGILANNPLYNRVRYKLLSGVDRRASSGSKLVVNCVLSHLISGFQAASVDLYPHRVANLCDLDIGRYPEVLYIGISNKDLIARLERHEKLQRILAQKGDDHDVIIHFLALDNKKIAVDPCEGGVLLVRGFSDVGVSPSDLTLIAETVLINHFKPELNVHKKKAELAKNEKVKKALVKKGFTEIYCEISTVGCLSRLGTGAVEGRNTHMIKYDLVTKRPAGAPSGK